MVEVKTMNEVGSFVKLLEYNDLEGFIAHSELSRANRIKGSISRVSFFQIQLRHLLIMLSAYQNWAKIRFASAKS